MLIASIWVSRRREKAGALEWARAGQVGIAAALAYIGVNGAITAKAVHDVVAQHGENPIGANAIASPVPLAFWERETIRLDRKMLGQAIVYRIGKWPNADENERQIPEIPCGPGTVLAQDETTGPQIFAFLFWSRAPFLTREADGSVVLRDARFTDPRVADRFSLALPDVKCEELTRP
jgi:inner membrane protein